MGSLTKDRTISSIHKISTLLTQYTSIDNVLESIAKEISYVFGFTRLIVFFVNKDKTLLECRHTCGFNQRESERAQIPYRINDHECVETRVVRTGKSIFVSDYLADEDVTYVDLKVSKIMNRVSSVTVPLKIKRGIIGLISADKDKTPLKMAREDLHTFEMFANQASIIIENTRLQEQNKKKITQLLTLQEVGQETSSTFHLETLAKIITKRALSLSKASICALYLQDDNRQQMGLAAEAVAQNVAKMPTGISVIDDKIIAEVAEKGAPLIIQESSRQCLVPNKAPVRSLLALPLISEQRVFGVLAVADEKKSAFIDDDLKVLTIFASHTASTIKNARLYSQIMTEKSFRENILESSPNGILSIDRSKKISSVNRRIEEIFAINRNDVLGAHAKEVFGEEISEVIEQAIEQHKVVIRQEVVQKNYNSDKTILGLTSSLLRNHQGHLIGALLIIRDLTKEKKQEALIRRIDRLASLGQLSAGIAHEIRNPLASIYFNVQLLEKKLELSENTQNLLSDTCKGIDRIRSLVKGMLDYAKPSTPSLERGSILRVLKETITLMRSQLRKKGIEVVLIAPEDPPDVVLDIHQIQQVFVNLLLNSMEAMSEGGTISIELREESTPDNQIILRFCDEGEGIATDDLGKIFNPFFTTKTEGTGLGLSIVHKILEQHNATAEVFSEQKKGSTFVLKFPISNYERSNVPL